MNDIQKSLGRISERNEDSEYTCKLHENEFNLNDDFTKFISQINKINKMNSS